MSDSVRPHRLQPTRLCHPWDSPGKNTGVGCHFLLQCMKVKSESEVPQSCPTPSDPMDCSPPGSSVRGIFQARVLERGAIPYVYTYIYIYNVYFSESTIHNHFSGGQKLHYLSRRISKAKNSITYLVLHYSIMDLGGSLAQEECPFPL